jgi:Fe2+ transport system protein FeoA
VIGLQFQSTDQSRAELAARLLRLAGVGAEVRRVGDEWQVVVYTGKLAAGHERLRWALAEIVEAVRSNGWVDEKRAERWLKKLEKGRVSKEGWPMYYVGLNDDAPVVIFSSTKSDRIEQVAQKFREMGLKEGKHFTVKMPKGGKEGYVFISSVGLRRAARLSVHGSGRQRELAEEFISYILKRAEEKSKAKKEEEDVHEKVKEVVEKGKSWGSLTLKGFAATVDGGYEVKVIDGSAEIEESWSGKKLLRLRITAEVNGVRDDYTITYIRDDRNKAMGYAVMRADAPGGRGADKERLSALVEALTGKKPWKDSKKIRCDREHLDGFARFAEFADAIEEWLEETGGG